MNLENVLEVALEGPVQGGHDIFNELIGIWKK